MAALFAFRVAIEVKWHRREPSGDSGNAIVEQAECVGKRQVNFVVVANDRGPQIVRRKWPALRAPAPTLQQT